MKILGVLTSDFTIYYDLVRALKARRVAFTSLVEGDPIPPNVGVVLAGPREAADVLDHPVVVYVAGDDPPDLPEGVESHGRADDAIDAALRHLAGHRHFHRVVVGVDPGDRPGIAVLGDGHVVATAQAGSPEEVATTAVQALDGLVADDVTVRVGHGAATQRDRIINILLDAGLPVEVVDETRTSPPRYMKNRERDIQAAKSIALAKGDAVEEAREVRPSEGEVRNIQRRSRLASRGRLTISRDLAGAVARGEITLDEALAEQRRKGHASPEG